MFSNNNRMFSNLDYQRVFGSQYRPGRVTGLDEMIKKGNLSNRDMERIRLAKKVDELKFIRGKKAVSSGVEPISRTTARFPEKSRY